MNVDEIVQYGFSKPAEYVIEVQGEISQESLWRYGGMHLEFIRKEQNRAVSRLQGRISDQSALSGILNALYDMHLVILSLRIVNEKIK